MGAGWSGDCVEERDLFGSVFDTSSLKYLLVTYMNALVANPCAVYDYGFDFLFSVWKISPMVFVLVMHGECLLSPLSDHSWFLFPYQSTIVQFFLIVKLFFSCPSSHYADLNNTFILWGNFQWLFEVCFPITLSAVQIFDHLMHIYILLFIFYHLSMDTNGLGGWYVFFQFEQWVVGLTWRRGSFRLSLCVVAILFIRTNGNFFLS